MAEKRIRVTTYLSPQLADVWRQIRERYPNWSESDVVAHLVFQEGLRISGGNTKEMKLDEILAQLKTLQAMSNMSMLLEWSMAGKQPQRFSPEDIATLKANLEAIKGLE